jgi:hypothetical protein
MRSVVLVSILSACVHVTATKFEDADVRAEVTRDRERVTLQLVNKTDAPLAVDWAQLTVVANHVEHALPDAAACWLQPGARAGTALALPPSKRLELIVPTVVRGTAREYHWRM